MLIIIETAAFAAVFFYNMYMDRDEFLQNYRGQILGEIGEHSTAGEIFQNQILRPILKLQNELFLEVFKKYFDSNKRNLLTLETEKIIIEITNAVQNDTKFRNLLIGIVVGLFTLEDYQQYIENSTSLNKRITSMIVERICSQLQYFTP